MYNKNSGRARFVIVLALIASAPILLMAQSEMITINNTKIFKDKTRTTVAFTHVNHMTLDGVECTTCHHRFENGKNVLDPSELSEGNTAVSCSACHKTKSDLETAYHRQCIQCHEKSARQGKTKGPRMCGECHKKNK